MDNKNEIGQSVGESPEGYNEALKQTIKQNCETLKRQYEEADKALTEQVDDLTKKVGEVKQEISDIHYIKVALQSLNEKLNEKANKTDLDLKVNAKDFIALQERCQDLSKQLDAKADVSSVGGKANNSDIKELKGNVKILENKKSLPLWLQIASAFGSLCGLIGLIIAAIIASL